MSDVKPAGSQQNGKRTYSKHGLMRQKRSDVHAAHFPTYGITHPKRPRKRAGL